MSSVEDGYCSSGSPQADSDEQTAGESPRSGEKRAAPSPSSSPQLQPPTKRSRRSVEKRVVSVPIADCGGGGDRPKGGGEGPPPSDSWAWRKYGQKPIKGSPYPRGYYRCSSSKGCPARKQVERSRADPTVLLVTYSFDHNHPWPQPKNHSHPSKPSTRPPAEKPVPAVEPELAEPETETETEQKPVSLVEPEITTVSPSSAAEATAGDEESFDCWLDQHYSTWNRSTLYAPALDVAPPLPPEEWEGELQGEDALFAGLGELPECAFVFGRRRELGLAATAPWCS